jgi:hypothetical protein
LFGFINGQTGADNKESQGFVHLVGCTNKIVESPSRFIFSRQSAIMSGETSQPSTSNPARRYGIRSRPVPHATSSAG